MPMGPMPMVSGITCYSLLSMAPETARSLQLAWVPASRHESATAQLPTRDRSAKSIRGFEFFAWNRGSGRKEAMCRRPGKGNK